MKKLIAIFILLLSCCIVFGLYSSTGPEKAAAQITDSEERKKMEWDKSVNEEKFERLRRESVSLQDAIKKVVITHYPKFEISSNSVSDPANAGNGRKGQSSFDISWKLKSTEYTIRITLLFNPEEAVNSHRRGVSSISLPEFYPAPAFLGTPAVLTKSIVYNKSMTDVGILFVKGRLKIATYLRNHRQTANQNEKDLIEFVRVIYPELNAKLTIEEV